MDVKDGVSVAWYALFGTRGTCSVLGLMSALLPSVVLVSMT